MLMGPDIHQNKTLKNIGIDKDSIAQLGGQSEEATAQPIEQKEVSQQELNQTPSIDVEALKKDILATTHSQLVGLANQMQAYADNINARLDRLEQRVRDDMRRENQDALKPQQEPQVQQPKQQESAESATKDEPEHDVSIQSMFDFSNTHGQNKPKPNR